MIFQKRSFRNDLSETFWGPCVTSVHPNRFYLFERSLFYNRLSSQEYSVSSMQPGLPAALSLFGNCPGTVSCGSSDPNTAARWRSHRPCPRADRDPHRRSPRRRRRARAACLRQLGYTLIPQLYTPHLSWCRHHGPPPLAALRAFAAATIRRRAFAAATIRRRAFAAAAHSPPPSFAAAAAPWVAFS